MITGPINNKTKLIYGLMDPRNNLIRYIGRSSNGLLRPKYHFNQNYNHTRSWSWIQSLKKQSMLPIIIILELGIDSEDLNKKEISWISFFKTNNYKLYNHQSGGEHLYTVDDYTKEKLRLSSTGKKMSDNAKNLIILGRLGKKHTEETKKRISMLNKGKTPWNKGVPRDIKTKEKISKKLIGRAGHRNPNKLGRKIKCLQTNKIYISAKKASIELNLDSSSIIKVCKGKLSQTGGYVFIYEKKSGEI